MRDSALHEIHARAIDEVIRRLRPRKNSTFGRGADNCYTEATHASFRNRVLALDAAGVILDSVRGLGVNATGAEALRELTPEHRQQLERIVDRVDRYWKIQHAEDHTQEFERMVRRWLLFSAPWLESASQELLAHIRGRLRKYTYEMDLLAWLLPTLNRWVVEQSALRFSRDLNVDLVALLAKLTNAASDASTALVPLGVVGIDTHDLVHRVLLRILQNDAQNINVPPPYTDVVEWGKAILLREIASRAVVEWHYIAETVVDAETVARRRHQVQLAAFKEIVP